MTCLIAGQILASVAVFCNANFLLRDDNSHDTFCLKSQRFISCFSSPSYIVQNNIQIGEKRDFVHQCCSLRRRAVEPAIRDYDDFSLTSSRMELAARLSCAMRCNGCSAI